MIDIEDTLDLTLALDSVLLAYERRTAGVTAHRPIDPLVLADVASCVDLSGAARPDGPAEWIEVLERIVGQLGADKRTTLADAIERDRARAIWRPDRGTQCQSFELALRADMMLFAGSTGSGKTEAAIGIGLLLHRIARYIRGTSLELQPILNRIGELIGSTDGRNTQDKVWRLEPPAGHDQRGAWVQWAGLSEPGKELGWQGRAHTLLCLDDAGSGTVPRERIDYVAQWLRTVEPGLHKLQLYTSNAPTSRDSLYLRDEIFAPWLSPDYDGEPAASGELRYFVTKGDTEVEVPPGTPDAQARTVVRSRTSDNVRLVRTGYLKQQQAAPTELLRKRLAEDDWTAGWDDDDAAQVIPGAWVDAAMQRWTPEPPCGLDTLGVDVARGGKDRSAIARRHDWWFAEPIVIPGADTPDGQSLAVKVLAVYQKGAIVLIDATGVGSSPLDILREKVPTSGVIFGASSDALDATQSFKFSNVRSLLWWQFRELLAEGQAALPPDERLKRELCMPRYELRGGKLFVEGRDEIIKRLGKSPDIATAYILAAIPTSSVLANVQSTALRRAIQASNEKWRKDMERRGLL